MLLGYSDHRVTLMTRENREQRGLKAAFCGLHPPPRQTSLNPPPLPNPYSQLTAEQGSPAVSIRRLPTSNMAARASPGGWAEPTVLARVALFCLYPAQSEAFPVFWL